jgi:adenine-specific DNA-methyltransferase
VSRSHRFVRSRRVALLGTQTHLDDITTQVTIPEWASNILEKTRQLLQSDINVADPSCDVLEGLYASEVPYDYRKAKGQFFTPPPVAELMVNWVLDRGAKSLLDPSVGTGIFIRAALIQTEQRGKSLVTVVGYETDQIMAEIARMSVKALGFQPPSIRQVDFVTDQFEDKFDAIVANPPYIRHHEMPYIGDVFAWFDRKCGFKLSRLTNIYGLFLLKILLSLSARGRAAVLIPSEFLNADFGVPIKKFLLDTNYLDSILIFDNNQLVFSDILTTACVVMLDANRVRDKPVRIVHMPNVSAIGELSKSLLLARPIKEPRNWQELFFRREALLPALKWTSLGKSNSQRSPKLVSLGEIADVMRGIATGANSFFTLNVEEVKKCGLEEIYLRPCITKANYAPHLDFSRNDFDELSSSGKKAYLLYYEEGPISSALRSYIELGERHGFHERYLTEHREPWFSTERREVAPVWVTVFGRQGLRFVLNRAGIWNLTAFHCIYPRFRGEIKIRALMAYLISDECIERTKEELRVYGDGLLKMEPRDVARLPVLNIPELPNNATEQLASLFDRLCLLHRSNGAWRESPAMDMVSEIIRSFL